MSHDSQDEPLITPKTRLGSNPESFPDQGSSHNENQLFQVTSELRTLGMCFIETRLGFPWGD